METYDYYFIAIGYVSCEGQGEILCKLVFSLEQDPRLIARG
jgi:hypothetical protein